MSGSKHTPAHARPEDADDAVGAHGPAGSPLAAALRDMTPPRHGPDFWSDDHKMAKSLKGADIPSPGRSSSRRTLVLAVAAVVVLLVAIAALQGPDDDTARTGGDDRQAESTDGRTPTSDES